MTFLNISTHAQWGMPFRNSKKLSKISTDSHALSGSIHKIKFQKKFREKISRAIYVLLANFAYNVLVPSDTRSEHFCRKLIVLLVKQKGFLYKSFLLNKYLILSISICYKMFTSGISGDSTKWHAKNFSENEPNKLHILYLYRILKFRNKFLYGMAHCDMTFILQNDVCVIL